MTTRQIGYRETLSTDYQCSQCQGAYVPNSHFGPFHYHHSPHCTLYRELSSSMLSDRERYARSGNFDRPYRDHELTLIDDAGMEVPAVDQRGMPVDRNSAANINFVRVYGVRGEQGFYSAAWQFLGLRKKTTTLKIN